MPEEQGDDSGMDMGLLQGTSAIAPKVMKVKVAESGSSSQPTPALAKLIRRPMAKHQGRPLTFPEQHLQRGRVDRKFERSPLRPCFAAVSA